MYCASVIIDMGGCVRHTEGNQDCSAQTAMRPGRLTSIHSCSSWNTSTAPCFWMPLICSSTPSASSRPWTTARMLNSTVRCLARGSDFEGAELEEALAESAFLPEGYEAPQQLGAARRSYLHGITRNTAAACSRGCQPLRMPWRLLWFWWTWRRCGAQGRESILA